MTNGQFLVLWSCGMLALFVYSMHLVGAFDSCSAHKPKEKKMKTEPKEVKAEETNPAVSRADAIKLLMDDAFFDRLLEDAGPNSGSAGYYPTWVCKECKSCLAANRRDAEFVDCCPGCGCTDAPVKTSYRLDYEDSIVESEHAFYQFYEKHNAILQDARLHVRYNFVLDGLRSAYYRKYKNTYSTQAPSRNAFCHCVGDIPHSLYGVNRVVREEKGASE